VSVLVTVDFSDLQMCHPVRDYRNYTTETCVNGKMRTYSCRLADRTCVHALDYKPIVGHEYCTCDRNDYECHIGFKMRARTGECIKSPNTQSKQITDCKKYRYISRGYRVKTGIECQPNNGSYLPHLVECSANDNKKDFIIYANEDNLVLYDFSAKSKEIIMNTGDGQFVFDYDHETDLLFYVDQTTSSIRKTTLKRSKSDGVVDAVAVGRVGRVKSICVDWIGKNIYWINETNSTTAIEVADFNGKHRRVLVNSHLAHRQFTSLAINPNEGFMYWIEMSVGSDDVHSIVRSCLDGTHQIILQSNLSALDHLALHSSGMIYWLDNNVNDIFYANTAKWQTPISRLSIDMMGTVLTNIAVYGSSVYWYDADQDSIMKTNRFNRLYDDPVVADTGHVTTFKVYAKATQLNEANACKFDLVNQCDRTQQLCISMPRSSRVCLCGADSLPGCEDTQTSSSSNKRTGWSCDSPVTCFTCKNGNQIAFSSVCDKLNDCGDYSDEYECKNVCNPNEFFRCLSGECVGRAQRCNSVYDCLDGSDEVDCEVEWSRMANTICPYDKFQCANGKCVGMERVCDKMDDCLDGSDEIACMEANATSHHVSPLGPSLAKCPNGKYECGDRCISYLHVCDGIRDCVDGTDELNCQTCKFSGWPCRNKKCILKVYVCNGVDDCGDLSDETDCARPPNDHKTDNYPDQRKNLIDNFRSLIGSQTLYTFGLKTHKTVEILFNDLIYDDQTASTKLSNYVVIIEGLNSDRTEQPIRTHKLTYSAQTGDKITIGDLRVAHAYNLKIYLNLSESNLHELYDDDEFNVTTSEYRPSPPQHVHVLQIDSTGLQIFWSKPETTNGAILYYTIWTTHGPVNKYNVDRFDDETYWHSLVLDNKFMRLGVLYGFWVIAHNSYGQSEKSNVFESRIGRQRASNMHINDRFSLMRTRTDMVNIGWMVVTPTGTAIQEYLVFATVDGPTDSIATSTITTECSASMQITNPSYNYTFEIISLYANGYSTESIGKIHLPSEYRIKTLNQPFDLTADKNGPDDRVRISWHYNGSHSENIRFYVQYGSDPVRLDWFSVVDRETSVLLDRFTPCEFYYVQVQAFNKQTSEYSMASQIHEFYALNEAQVCTKHLHSQLLNRTHVRLNWYQCCGARSMQHDNNFKLDIYDNNNTMRTMVLHGHDLNTTAYPLISYDIDRLTPGHRYSVNLTCDLRSYELLNFNMEPYEQVVDLNYTHMSPGGQLTWSYPYEFDNRTMGFFVYESTDSDEFRLKYEIRNANYVRIANVSSSFCLKYFVCLVDTYGNIGRGSEVLVAVNHNCNSTSLEENKPKSFVIVPLVFLCSLLSLVFSYKLINLSRGFFMKKDDSKVKVKFQNCSLNDDYASKDSLSGVYISHDDKESLL
jgi:hypothetical protein